MTWVEVLNAIKDVGVSIVLIAAVIYLLVKYFSLLIDNKIGKKTSKLPEVESSKFNSVAVLKETHPVFNKINGIIDTKLPITTIGGPVRTEIFRDVLTIFYETALYEIAALLDKNMTSENFLANNYNMANSVIKDSSAKMRRAGIPDVVIEKFNTWNSPRHEYVLSTITDIDASDVFSSLVEKQYAALNLYMDSMYFVLMDAEKTLKNLNGDLTGAVYKGKVVEGLH